MLFCLKSNGSTVNTLKRAWAIQGTNSLGYWSMPTGLRPWRKHISAILELKPPCNINEMCGFLDAVNKYWLMRLKWAHLLKPLSNELGKNPFVGHQKWIKSLRSWKISWQPQHTFHQLPKSWNWLKLNSITIPCRKNSSLLSCSSKTSAPSSLVLTSPCVMITKFKIPLS